MTLTIDRLERPSVERKPPRILRPEEVIKLLARVREKRPKALAWFVLGLFAGIRPDEVSALTWSSIDLFSLPMLAP